MAKNEEMLVEKLAHTILPRNLSRFDLTAIYFAAIFGSFGAAQMATMGWAAIPMLIMAAVVFLLPCALAAFELGTLFPGEGGIYIWAHKAFGPLHGFISGWLSWVPIFLILPLGVTASSAYIQEAFHTTWPKSIDTMIQLALIWVEFLFCARGLGISQNVVRVGFFVSFGTAVIVFIVGWIQPVSATPITSDIISFNIFAHGALFSAAVLWMLGVEMPFTMGDEFSNHRKTAKTMLVWGTLTLITGYLLGTTGILWSIPVEKVDVTRGVAQAVSAHYPVLGSIVAIAVSIAIMSTGINYENMYSRLLFVSALEKRLPAVFAHVNEKKVPIRALLVQAIGASIVILIFSTQESLAVVFNLYLAALVAIWCASLYYIFAALLIVRKKYDSLYQSRGADVWHIPGGLIGRWFVGIWGIVANTIAIYYVFALPWVSEGITAQAWRGWIAAIVAVVIGFGVILYSNSLKQQKAI